MCLKKEHEILGVKEEWPQKIYLQHGEYSW